MAKTSFNELLLAVAPEYRVFVKKLNDRPLKQGCELVIKEVKNGYTATYQLERKTIVNWVFRKIGTWTRIYEDNAGRYEKVIAALSAHIQKKMMASRDCKGLTDPDACSNTCTRGFAYSLSGETQKKCRNDEMLSLPAEEAAEYIVGLICIETTARKPALQQSNRQERHID